MGATVKKDIGFVTRAVDCRAKPCTRLFRAEGCQCDEVTTAARTAPEYGIGAYFASRAACSLLRRRVSFIYQRNICFEAPRLRHASGRRRVVEHIKNAGSSPEAKNATAMSRPRSEDAAPPRRCRPR